MTLPQEVFELSAWAQRLGVADPAPALRSISMIDTDTIRHVGTHAWTLSRAISDEWRSQFVARYILADEADRLLRLVSSDGWDDAGFLAFERHMQGIADRMQELSGQCAVIGDQLVEIADTFEMHWVELCGLVVATLALILAIALLGPAIITFMSTGALSGLIVSVSGFIVSYAGFIVAMWASIKPRMEVLVEATEQFDEIAPPGRWLDPEPG